MIKKRFIKINEEFICKFCGHKNPPAQKTCRNHCQKCLKSIHIDKNPGDRAENCHGTLFPISYKLKNGVIEKIIFKCQKCGIIRKNKIAENDNKEIFWQSK